MRPFFILTPLFFVCTACQSNQPFTAENRKLVLRPGVVAVDVLRRKEELARNQKLTFCGTRSPPIPILSTVSAPDGYGLDPRYKAVGYAIRRAGSACLAGDQRSCKNIQSAALSWAHQFSLESPGGAPNTSRFWNDTLTINMRLLNPLISALAVADSLRPMLSGDKNFVNKWLKEMIQNFEHGMRSAGHYPGGKYGTFAQKSAHNHAVQSSLASMSYGAWIGEDRLFRIGLEQWDLTIGSMRQDGSLPIETRRGARALFYHGRTLAGLVQLAERANLQGINLYDRMGISSKNIHKAVKFFIEATLEPKLIIQYAKTNYVPGPSKNFSTQYLGGSGSSTFAWVAPYISRFPDHPNTRVLISMKTSDSPLARKLVEAVKMNGTSAEWIGVDARCFYASFK